jgi:fructose-bisphosphate aldolase class 1
VSRLKEYEKQTNVKYNRLQVLKQKPTQEKEIKARILVEEVLTRKMEQHEPRPEGIKEYSMF